MTNRRSFTVEFFKLLWSAKTILFVLLLLIIIGGIIFSYEGFGCGKREFLLGQYVSFITALTIGYGDMTPDGPLGKLFAVFLGMVGMLLMGIIVGASVKALEKTT